MTTYISVRDQERFGRDFLQDILTWVADHMAIDEVFDKETITAWVTNNCTPDEIFDEIELGAWALRNGYQQEE
jgi:hypothetical protein